MFFGTLYIPALKFLPETHTLVSNMIEVASTHPALEYF